jgi:DNA invertase Pin-like site-specific DNA recombinase
MEAVVQKIIQAYTSDRKSLRDIAVLVGMDRVTVKNILKRNNIPLRSRIEAMNEKLSFGEDIENKIVNMYQEGYLPNEIIEKVHVSNTTIFRILKKRNIETKGKLGLVKRYPAKKRKFVKQTDEFEQSLIQDYMSGLTTYDLEKKYGISRTHICKLFAKRNVEMRSVRALSDEEENKAIELYSTTELPSSKIADQFNVTTTTLYNILKKKDISLRENNVSPLAGKDNEIIDLYNLGESADKIAKKLHSNPSTIQKILNRNNIEIRDASHSKQIYTINESYFDLIDTADKAYFLGFLYADGTNSSTRNCARLQLADYDISVLEKFNACLGSNRPLYFRKSKKENESDMYVLSINNKRISQQLYKLGVVDRKTLILEFPKWLDKTLYNHFIRGYFDGDGSMSHNFQIAGTESFLQTLQEILMKECILNKTKLTRVKNIYVMSYGGRQQLIRIKNYLYQNATIYLERKKVKFPC